jgi:hypothetical protein
MISLLPQVSDDGAVVFASQRKDVKFLDMTRINNYIVLLTTPIGISNLGWKHYLIYAVLNAVFVPVVYVETAGLSLEDILVSRIHVILSSHTQAARPNLRAEMC